MLFYSQEQFDEYQEDLFNEHFGETCEQAAAREEARLCAIEPEYTEEDLVEMIALDHMDELLGGRYSNDELLEALKPEIRLNLAAGIIEHERSRMAQAYLESVSSPEALDEVPF